VVDTANMRALSIRQPYAELIPSTGSGQALRGIKTIEYRSRPTRIIGEPFYIYASKGRRSTLILPSTLTPTGSGRARTAEPGGYQWHLSGVRRIARPRKPRRMPQPVWFKPF
jgi:hypothetical protein